MSYFKCKDCNYFQKSFIYNWCTYKEEVVIGIGSPCSCFSTNLKMCGECSLYKDNGKCRAMSGKRYSNHPACEFFKPQSEDCFLTSACVEYMGKPDDCQELTVLRSFRDGYLKSTECGEELIKEYYEIAPEIVKRIKSSEKEKGYYDYIYGVVLKCVNLINEEKNAETLNEYKNMVLKLKDELL